jgi:hypothetical protein
VVSRPKERRLGLNLGPPKWFGVLRKYGGSHRSTASPTPAPNVGFDAPSRRGQLTT